MTVRRPALSLIFPHRKLMSCYRNPHLVRISSRDEMLRLGLRSVVLTGDEPARNLRCNES